MIMSNLDQNPEQPRPRVPTPEINPGAQPNEYQPTPQPNANPPETPMEVPPVHE